MKLSIITICLNDEDGLKKTVSSVINQSFQDFEYIIIDGGSVDGSLEYLKSTSSKIAHITSEKDSGIYYAMNKGIKIANGDYCLFLNSGDYLVHENILRDVFVKEIDTDIIYGNMLIEYDNGSRRIGKMPSKLSITHMIADTLWHPVSFIKRDLFAKFGMYDVSLRMVADYDFFLKTVIVNKASTCYLDFPISVFNLKGFSSLPANKKILQAERSRVQKTYFTDEQLESVQKKIKFVHSILGRILSKLGWRP